MKIITTSYAVFACHDKSCAPPPAGPGGSSGGAGGGHTFKSVVHAKNTAQKLANKGKDRTPEDEVRMRAAILYVNKNMQRLPAKRDPKNTDDGYDALKDGRLDAGIRRWERPMPKRY